MQTTNKKYLTPAEIAAEIEVDVQTVRLWCRKGYLPASKFGKEYRVLISDFEKWKSAQRVAA